MNVSWSHYGFAKQGEGYVFFLKNGTASVDPGDPPADPDKDWVALLRR